MDFDAAALAAKLLSVVPYKSADYVIQIVKYFHEHAPGEEADMFLRFYFYNKDQSVDDTTITKEAEDIVRLYPYYSVDYVKSRLKVMGSERNRVEVVLRQMLDKKKKNNGKRKLPQENAGAKKPCAEGRFTDEHANDGNGNVLSVPATSTDCEDALPAEILDFVHAHENNARKEGETVNRGSKELEPHDILIQWLQEPPEKNSLQNGVCTERRLVAANTEAKKPSTEVKVTKSDTDDGNLLAAALPDVGAAARENAAQGSEKHEFVDAQRERGIEKYKNDAGSVQTSANGHGGDSLVNPSTSQDEYVKPKKLWSVKNLLAAPSTSKDCSVSRPYANDEHRPATARGSEVTVDRPDQAVVRALSSDLVGNVNARSERNRQPLNFQLTPARYLNTKSEGNQQPIHYSDLSTCYANTRSEENREAVDFPQKRTQPYAELLRDRYSRAARLRQTTYDCSVSRPYANDEHRPATARGSKVAVDRPDQAVVRALSSDLVGNVNARSERNRQPSNFQLSPARYLNTKSEGNQQPIHYSDLSTCYANTRSEENREAVDFPQKRTQPYAELLRDRYSRAARLRQTTYDCSVSRPYANDEHRPATARGSKVAVDRPDQAVVRALSSDLVGNVNARSERNRQPSNFQLSPARYLNTKSEGNQQPIHYSDLSTCYANTRSEENREAVDFPQKRTQPYAELLRDRYSRAARLRQTTYGMDNLLSDDVNRRQEETPESIIENGRYQILKDLPKERPGIIRLKRVNVDATSQVAQQVDVDARTENVGHNERPIAQVEEVDAVPLTSGVSINPIHLSDTDTDSDSTIDDETFHNLYGGLLDHGKHAQEVADGKSALDVDDSMSEEDVDEYPCDSKLKSTLMEMFPDASPNYIQHLCTGKVYSHEVIDEIMNVIFANPSYPRRKRKSPSPEHELDFDEKLKLLQEILPEADPDYLRHQAELYSDNEEKMKAFIADAVEKKDYPTMKDYLRKKQLSAQALQYTTDFKVDKFLEVIPDPEAYFNDPQRKPTLSNKDWGCQSLNCAITTVRNLYLTVPLKLVNAILQKHNYNLVKVADDLDLIVKSGKGLLKSRRKRISLSYSIETKIPVLQEIAYVQHRAEIRDYIRKQKEEAEEEKKRAKEGGLLCTCNCCFDDEVMPSEIEACQNDCAFCKDCIRKSVEIAFGEGKLDFACLGDCPSSFSLQTLMSVLSPKLFSKMAQKQQLQEVKAAGIEDLETCPFCDFATIPAPGDKLFRCLNPECMKESCRECKEPSHVPLRCDEVEKDDDVKKRVYIENKMTEALLRKCPGCGMKFVKADGCNKMTCSCGAMMCYLCRQPVKDYTHFNGQGGDQYHLCPLYSDTNALHRDAVLKSAEQAKAEIGVRNEPGRLKNDPTVDVDRHYRRLGHEQVPLGIQLQPPHIQGDVMADMHNRMGFGGRNHMNVFFNNFQRPHRH